MASFLNARGVSDVPEQACSTAPVHFFFSQRLQIHRSRILSPVKPNQASVVSRAVFPEVVQTATSPDRPAGVDFVEVFVQDKSRILEIEYERSEIRSRWSCSMYKKRKHVDDRSLPAMLVCEELVSEGTQLDCALGDRGCARTFNNRQVCLRHVPFQCTLEKSSLSVAALACGRNCSSWKAAKAPSLCCNGAA